MKSFLTVLVLLTSVSGYASFSIKANCTQKKTGEVLAGWDVLELTCSVTGEDEKGDFFSLGIRDDLGNLTQHKIIGEMWNLHGYALKAMQRFSDISGVYHLGNEDFERGSSLLVETSPTCTSIDPNSVKERYEVNFYFNGSSLLPRKVREKGYSHISTGNAYSICSDSLGPLRSVNGLRLYPIDMF
jgi:hypothetical protein